jgi:hypothetical protein
LHFTHFKAVLDTSDFASLLSKTRQEVAERC